MLMKCWVVLKSKHSPQPAKKRSSFNILRLTEYLTHIRSHLRLCTKIARDMQSLLLPVDYIRVSGPSLSKRLKDV